ncbi:hypothetical protein J31TS3_02870 [Paenibacillus lactis]|nr:hypothetical protein J31TS3_02870 [Paenibacillus lactis]
MDCVDAAGCGVQSRGGIAAAFVQRYAGFRRGALNGSGGAAASGEVRGAAYGKRG